MKTHLYKVVGSQMLTYEELNTVLTQIECLLNSRPLGMNSEDPSDFEPFTPARLISETSGLDHLPMEDVLQVPVNRLSRPQLVDSLVQHYWRRWSKEYLHTLQARMKWTTPQPSIERGKIVLMMDEDTPPLKWPKGVIVDVHPGPDGVVRVVTVRTQMDWNTLDLPLKCVYFQINKRWRYL